MGDVGFGAFGFGPTLGRMVLAKLPNPDAQHPCSFRLFFFWGGGGGSCFFCVLFLGAGGVVCCFRGGGRSFPVERGARLDL